jgi:hypothetical protein
MMKLENVQTRSFSPENFDGAKGRGGMATTGTGAHAARELGQGWKISPSIILDPGETIVVADIRESGQINHFWMTAPNNRMRDLVLRMYWDDQKMPSVEVPAADFFCDGWIERPLVNSKTIVLASANGYNSYWRMPFRHSARITLENIGNDNMPVYYQGMYDLKDIDDDEAYFHASWRRAHKLGKPSEFTIVDGIQGSGYYVGTYLAIQPNVSIWWGEGEVKFYMDSDKTWPTICGTGTEDYFGGAWNFDRNGVYVPYSTPYLGFHQVTPPGAIYKSYQRFGMYRWHLPDRIRFHSNLKVTIQAIGAGDNIFVPLENADIAAMAVWYQMASNIPPQKNLIDHQASDLGHASLADYLRVDPQ